MATPKEEKLLASIDGTLKDILKELKRKNRDSAVAVEVNGPSLAEKVREELKRTERTNTFGG